MLRLKVFIVVLLISIPLFSAQNRMLFMGAFTETDTLVNPAMLHTISKEVDADLFSAGILPTYTPTEIAPYQTKIADCKLKTACFSTIAIQMQATLFLYATVNATTSGIFKTQLIMMNSKGIEIARIIKQGSQDNVVALLRQSVTVLAKKTLSFMIEKQYRPLPNIPNMFQKTQYDSAIKIDVMAKVQKVPVVINKLPAGLTQSPQMPATISQKERELFTAALRQDRLGEPLKVVAAWKTFMTISTNPQLLEWAKKRVTEWLAFVNINKDRDLIMKAMQYERETGMFPDKIYAEWNKVQLSVINAEYKNFAAYRMALYKPVTDKITEWIKKEKELIKNSKEKYKELKQAFSTNRFSFDQKYLLLSQFMVSFAPVGGFGYVKQLITETFSKDDQKIMMFNLFSQQIANRFNSECQQGTLNSCLVAVDMYGELNNQQKQDDTVKLGCAKGINRLCSIMAEKLIKTERTKGESIAKNSCISLDSKGCLLLATALPDTPQTEHERKIVLYKRACTLGSQEACAFTQPKVIVKAKPIDSTVKQTLETPIVAPLKKEKKKRISITQKHPLFWYGLPLLAAGVALDITSIYFFTDAAKSYDKYNELTDPEILRQLYQFGTEEDMKAQMSAANKALSDGDKSNNIAIGTLIAGGTLTVTGIILMVVKPKTKKGKKVAELVKPIQLTVLPGGAFASTTIHF